MMMGKDALYAKASKQKLNTKSSTEAELIGATNFAPQTLWTAHFMAAQGYIIKGTNFAQDNKSAMSMEQNRRASAGQRSRRINIRLFL